MLFVLLLCENSASLFVSEITFAQSAVYSIKAVVYTVLLKAQSPLDNLFTGICLNITSVLDGVDT